MRAEVEGQYGEGAVKLDLAKMRMSKDLLEKDRRLEELAQQQVSNQMHYAYQATCGVMEFEYSRGGFISPVVQLLWLCMFRILTRPVVPLLYSYYIH